MLNLTQRKVIRQALKDLHSDHVLTSLEEVQKACVTVFKQRYLKVAQGTLKEAILEEEQEFCIISKASTKRRNYTKRSKPRTLAEGSRAHYTNAERNFTQTIMKTLNKHTSYDLLRGKHVEKVIDLFRELYPRIFGNDPFRTDQAIRALVRKEQKRVRYGFQRYLPSICEDDVHDMSEIRRRLRKLVVRRVKCVEDEQPFIL